MFSFSLPKTTRLTVLALACAGLFAFDSPAEAAPPLPQDRVISLDLKQANIRNVYMMMSKAAGKSFVSDECVQGTVDLTMKNTPVSLVLDALALKLHLTYTDEGDAIRVGCSGTESTGAKSPAPAPDDRRFTIAVKQVTITDVLEVLSNTYGLEGVDYQAPTKPTLDFTVQRARLGTTISALQDQTGLSIIIRNKKLVVTAPR